MIFSFIAINHIYNLIKTATPAYLDIKVQP